MRKRTCLGRAPRSSHYHHYCHHYCHHYYHHYCHHPHASESLILILILILTLILTLALPYLLEARGALLVRLLARRVEQLPPPAELGHGLLGSHSRGGGTRLGDGGLGLGVRGEGEGLGVRVRG